MYAQMKEIFLNDEDGQIKDPPLSPAMRYGDYSVLATIEHIPHTLLVVFEVSSVRARRL